MINYFLTRFPILLMACTSLSQILGTFFVLRIPIDTNIVCVFLIFSLLFLFFIRVIDDYKDREHDSKHYPERAIQSGQIDLRMLLTIASVGIICWLGLLWYFFWLLPFIFASLWVANNLLGILWFWYGRDYKFKHIFFYSILNGLSLAFIQLALYSVSDIQSYAYSYVGILFFLMVYSNNHLFEIARKIRSKWDARHGDSYIELLGERRSFYLLASTIFIITLINVLISEEIGTSYQLTLLYCLSTCLFIILLWWFQKLQTRKLKYSVLSVTILFYMVSNLLHFYL